MFPQSGEPVLAIWGICMSRIYRVYKTRDRFIDVSAMCPSEALTYARACGFIHGFYWDIVRI